MGRITAKNLFARKCLSTCRCTGIFRGGSRKGEETNDKRRIACWLGDGAYDSDMVFEELEGWGISRGLSLR